MDHFTLLLEDFESRFKILPVFSPTFLCCLGPGSSVLRVPLTSSLLSSLDFFWILFGDTNLLIEQECKTFN